MDILNHTISEKTEQIISKMYNQLHFQVEYSVSFDETSYIDIKKDSEIYNIYT